MGRPLLQAVRCKGQRLARLHADLLTPQAQSALGSASASLWSSKSGVMLAL